MIRWCHTRQIEPILVIWPVRSQLFQGGVYPKQRVLARVAETEGVHLVNLIPWFQQRLYAQELYVDAIHASPAGMQVVADAILPTLRSVLEDSASRLAGR